MTDRLLTFKSGKKALNEQIALDIDPGYAHCFAGIRYYNAAGDVIAPASGNVRIQIKKLTSQAYIDAHNATIQATAPGSEAEWGNNVVTVQATPSSLAGAGLTHYELVVVQNLS